MLLSLELPNGGRFDFESPEAFAIAVQRMREGKPITIKREDGIDEVLWAPEDDRH